MKSNHHVLTEPSPLFSNENRSVGWGGNDLGNKRHTMVTTKRRNLVIVSQALNVISVRIEGCNSPS